MKTTHPAIRLLVEAVTTRLQSNGLPESAVRGALLEVLSTTRPPEERLTPWISEVTYRTCVELCRRMGAGLPDLPSIAIESQMPRDWSSEIVEALLGTLDDEHAPILRQLEVGDARVSQVAVRLGQPPQRIRVRARHAREQMHAVLTELAGGQTL
ncbi:MAG: hypothetical protein AB8H79_06130 [Myxococcota bacterium]